MAVPYTFATATTSIPLSQLDSNFATPITLGNTAIQLGNTVTTLNNMTMANVTISSVASTFPNNYLANSTATLGNATITLGGTTSTVGNLTLTNATISSGTYSVTNATVSGSLTLSGGTANGVAYLNGSNVLTTGSALTFDGTNFGVNSSSTIDGGRFSVAFAGNTQNGIGLKDTADASGASFWGAYNSTGGFIGSLRRSGTDNALAINGNSYLAFQQNSTEQMRLTSTGLGIGTSSPGQPLVVSKNQNGSTWAQVSNTTSGTGAAAGVLLTSDAGIQGTLELDSSGHASFPNMLRLRQIGAYPIGFFTNDTERARIFSGGNFAIGTTNDGSLPSSGIWIAPSYDATSASGIAIGHANGSASGNTYMGFVYNGSKIGSITQNGTTGVLYNLTSDYRLKNNPTALTGAKEFVMALQPKTWDWWDGSGKGVGFIAHEFMEVAKYSGNGEKDAVDADGKPVYQSIQPSSSEVMANLVALLQEQQAIIEQLKADVAALKGA